LTSALDGGEWSASRPGRFTPGKRALRNHWMGGWVDPNAGKNSYPHRDLNSDPAAVEPVASRYTDYAIRAH
jgi:hypothetical protein